jgi:hypothetical protein
MDETIKLRFLERQPCYAKEKRYQVIMSGQDEKPDFRDTNLIFVESPPISIHDIRGKEKDFSLDANGFAVCHQESRLNSFNAVKDIEEVYLPEVERLIRKEASGADTIHFFDWRVCFRFRD